MRDYIQPEPTAPPRMITVVLVAFLIGFGLYQTWRLL